MIEAYKQTISFCENIYGSFDQSHIGCDFECMNFKHILWTDT